MAARKGNRFWENRSSHGRDPLFDTPGELWEASCEYFQWVEDNPIKEEKVFHHQGRITRTTVDKMRAMTITGLCLYLDITQQTLMNYEKREDFFGIVKKIKEIIYEQKFTGAAADQLNPNIIARDLGLSDKKDFDHKSSDGSMKPSVIDASDLSNDAIEEILRAKDKKEKGDNG